MYKFRPRKPGAEQRLGRHLGEELTRLTAAELTRAGIRLRRSKLDELPQLWNVLRGDMSLVGPRPIRPAFFEELVISRVRRSCAKPVTPGRDDQALPVRRDLRAHWSEKLAHDFEYVADRSVGLYAAVLA